jgi:arylsulfatase
MYDDGPDALRLRRLAKLQELGLVAKGINPHDVVVGPMNTEWDAMSDYERKCSARAMECYAGMVDNMDQNIGKIVEYLKKTGEFESKSQNLIHSPRTVCRPGFLGRILSPVEGR